MAAMVTRLRDELSTDITLAQRFERRVTVMVLACTLLAPVLALLAP